MKTNTNEVMISSILPRCDNIYLDNKGVEVNRLLNTLCSVYSFHFVENCNISKEDHLNKGGLLLNSEGTYDLANNLVRSIRLWNPVRTCIPHVVAPILSLNFSMASMSQNNSKSLECNLNSTLSFSRPENIELENSTCLKWKYYDFWYCEEFKGWILQLLRKMILLSC